MASSGVFYGFFLKKMDEIAYEQRRRLAWEALRNTRNPEYVSLRYGFSVQAMREALAKLPNEEPLWKQLQAPQCRPKGNAPPPVPQVEREPGEDDDLEC